MLSTASRMAQFLGLLLLAVCSVAAAAPLSLRFNHFGVEQGLAQESVTRVIQDSHGYLWVGTQAGLNRYDGNRTTVFKNSPSAPNSLVDNYVQALYEDDKGQLWVGTRGGLDRFDPATQRFIHHATRPANLTVTNIVGDGAQGLWLSTSEGLQHLDLRTGQTTSLRHDPVRLAGRVA